MISEQSLIDRFLWKIEPSHSLGNKGPWYHRSGISGDTRIIFLIEYK